MPRNSCPNFLATLYTSTHLRKLRLLVSLLLILPLTGFLSQVAHAAAGDLDPSFGVGGKRTTDFLGNDDVGAAVVVQPDGKVVVAGIALSGDVGDFALARYNADGSPDSSFGTGGKTTTDFFGDIDLAFGVALQPSDGKIVAVGTAVRFVNNDHYETFFALARYNTNGTLDSDFGTGGRVTSDVLGINIHQTPFVVFVQSALGVVIQPDNKVVVVGGIIDSAAAFGTPAPLSDFGIGRFNSNGTPNTGFNGDGFVQRDFFGRDDLATSVALQPDNKIVAAGFATKNTSPFDVDFAWLRYDANGNQDTSIGNAGRVTTDFAGNTPDGANAMVLQPDGKIVLGGFVRSGTFDMALIRYNADASLDGSFGTGGKVTISVFNDYDELFGLALQPDGKLVASGGAAPLGGTEDIVVARLTSGGGLDPTFGSNGKVTTDFSGGDDFGAGVTLQPDGKILVSGAADTGTFTDLAVLRYVTAPALPPPTVQLSSATFSVSETGPQAIITVTRSGDTSGVSSVAYATSDTAGANTCNVNNGVASSRCDYLTTIGTMQFAANETSRTIGIPIVDDAYDETDENFTFTISNASGATLVQTQLRLSQLPITMRRMDQTQSTRPASSYVNTTSTFSTASRMRVGSLSGPEKLRTVRPNRNAPRLSASTFRRRSSCQLNFKRQVFWFTRPGVRRLQRRASARQYRLRWLSFCRISGEWEKV